MKTIRTLPCFVLSLLAAGLTGPSALAQGSANPPAPAASDSPEVAPTPTESTATPRERVGSDIEHEPDDGFCRDHWFAMGKCAKRKWAGPVLMFGGDFGVSVMNEGGPFGFNTGVGTVTNPGPAWGARVGIELFCWLALEARYVGMYNSAQASVSAAGSVGYFTTAGIAVVRFTAPLPFVHPYILGGGGYYDNSLIGSSNAKAGSLLISSAQPGAAMGVGFDVPLTWHVSVGAEATYHFVIGESFSNVTTPDIGGGDFSTFNAVVRFRL